MNCIQRKRLALMQNRKFKGYLKAVSGVPLTLTDCMGGKLVSLSVTGDNIGDISDNGYIIPITVSGANLLDVSETSGVSNKTNNSFDYAWWGDVVLKNAWVAEHLKPSATYYMKYDVVKLSDASGVSTGATMTHNEPGFILYSSVTGKTYGKMRQVMENEYETESRSYVFTTPDDIKDTSQKYQIWGYTDRWLDDEGNTTSSKYRFSNIIISEIDTEYEPYKAQTTNIYLDEPLTGVLEITEDIPIFEGTTVITADTSVQPADMSAEYYSKKP